VPGWDVRLVFVAAADRVRDGQIAALPGRKTRLCAKTGSMHESLERLLEDVAAGARGVEEAAAELRKLGYAAVGDFARVDVARESRAGIPEVVYAEGKTTEQLVAIVERYAERSGLVICSRTSGEQAEAVGAAVEGSEYDPRSRVLTVHRGSKPPERGVAGVLAAGTSDVGVAEEAAVMCRAMGVKTLTHYDVGVAGLHRLAGPLDELREAGAAALVVAAGMEGALPSVVAGLVDVPVVGLPTSTGYGLGGRGEAALLGMLQSCSPGLVVVNIDNGIGAGATAALIARRAAS
jgi:pyridinium-3,5-biscarboxylic acid mononucleotide synthase